MHQCKFVTNTSDGVRSFEFNQETGLTILKKELDNAAKALVFTPDGTKLVVSDGETLNIRDSETNETISSIVKKNISKLTLSPDANILVTYESFRKTKEHPDGFPNLHVYDVNSGNILDSRVHIPAETWKPQWSLDSKLCTRMFQGELQFYTDNKLGEKPTKRLNIKGMRHCSLANSSINRNIAVYCPGEKSTPATVNIYAWRNGDCVPLTNKSFFRADTVSLYWSDSGTSLLVLATTKTSDTSYYGEQMLHFLTTAQSGDSASVPMTKKGPIHQVLWKPTGSHDPPSDERFVVCQGTFPAAVMVFNLKCEKMFSLGSGPWNQIYFNPHGNLLLAGGFGSLNGSVAVWDFKSKQKLSEFSAQNSTNLTWLSDGEHLLTAITTPRLRVNNGFTIWHYTGRQIAHEIVEKRANPRAATVDLPAATEHELYQVLSQPVPFDRLPTAPTPGQASTGQAKQNLISTIEKPRAYVPPALQNRSATAAHAAAVASGSQKVNLKGAAHLTFESTSGPIGGIAVANQNGAVGGGKKKKNNAQKTVLAGDATTGIPKNPSQTTTSPKSKASAPPVNEANQKQITFIKKKLRDIEKLKDLQKNTPLDRFQRDKLEKEADFLEQLVQLQL